jgi:hypothetical protein
LEDGRVFWSEIPERIRAPEDLRLAVEYLFDRAEGRSCWE